MPKLGSITVAKRVKNSILWLSWISLMCVVQAMPLESIDDEIPVNCGGEYGQPLITPCKDDVKLEAGSSYTLRCEAEEPISWWHARNGGEQSSDSFVNTEDASKPYGIELVLHEVSVSLVGAYYCIKRSDVPANGELLDEDLMELVNNNLASTIYVYVHDVNNLLVREWTPIDVHQYSDVFIPCKPAMPDVEVLLTFNGETFSSETTGRYDPRRGFLTSIRSITDAGYYFCRPKIPAQDNEEEETIITLQFLGNEHIDTENATNLAQRPSTTTVTNIEVLDEHKSIGVTNNTTTLTTGVVGLVAIELESQIESDYSFGADDDSSSSSSSSSSSASASHSAEDLQDDISLRRKRGTPASTTPPTSLGQARSTRRHASQRINKPTISSTSGGHVYEGQGFELVCELSAPPTVRYTIVLQPPASADPSHIENNFKAMFDSNMKNATHIVGRKILRVHNATRNDSGIYKCNVTDQLNNWQIARYQMTVMAQNTSYLEINEPSNHYAVRENANKTVQITATVRGYPQPQLKWYKPDGTEIWETEPKYQILSTETSTTLKILNAQLVDSGTYTLKGTNHYDNKQLKFNVSIYSKPIVSVQDVYVQDGAMAHLSCNVKSFPQSTVKWTFTPCSIRPRWPSCNMRLMRSFISEKHEPGELSIEYIYQLDFVPNEPGIITCIAENKVNNEELVGEGKAHVLIGDIAENMTIYGLEESRKIARGDLVNFTCAALAYHFAGDLEWYRNGDLVTEDSDVQVKTSHTDYSYKKTLQFKSIEDHNRGTYECRARHVQQPDDYDSRDINVFVHEPAAPQWASHHLDATSKIERKLGESLSLECRSHAIPQANVHWYKDNKQLFETNLTHILEEQSKLLITHLYPQHDGVYKCVVENRLGSIEKSVTLIITDVPGVKAYWIWSSVALLVLMIIMCGISVLCYYKVRKQNKELKAAGLYNFAEGAVEHINPAMSFDEQADLLPYDRNFEFPREKLKLGKQLGAGAFGVVLKGEAEGIHKDMNNSIVAVKMVKRTADNEVVRALVSELKIMIHLGQHLNVVNLLGAVTKNIAKRELMVIVEYCRFGNIQNFLLRNRKCFINQINPTTNRIDPTIVTQRLSENFDLHRNSDNDPRSGTRAGRPGSAGYSYDRQTDTCATEATVMTTVPEDDDHVMSNNSLQPAWRSNYKTDSTEAMTVTTSDLVSWAFQVARGMDYLSSRRVIHGDLAARNILLCDDNVVKICDFGLARSMYRGDIYKKTESAKLPIKWLALESLSDYVFSTYTDVWSFGIVMWELFSLAKVPYPGVDPNQELYEKLKAGYRMEKPPYANDDLYDIMLECWSQSPERRPLFNALEKRFAHMLGDEVTNHYLDLNEPYMHSNTEYMKNRPTDYLALMGAPDELAPAPPRYVNGHILPEIRIEESSDDYLQMNTENSTAIFSPTRPKGDTSQVIDNAEKPAIQTTETSFTFPDARNDNRHSPTLVNNMDNTGQKALRKKNGLPLTVDAADQAPEEIPMLHRISTSDGEASPEQSRRNLPALKLQRPTPSPRHHVETKLNGDNDSYVNISNVKPPRKNLPNKSAVGGPDAFSNPSYQPLKSVSDDKGRRY